MRLCGRIGSLMASSSRQRTRQRFSAQLNAHPPASSRGLPMPIIVLMSSFVNCEQFNIRLTDYGHREPLPPASHPRFPPARPRPKPRPPPCARAHHESPPSAQVQRSDGFRDGAGTPTHRPRAVPPAHAGCAQ